MVTSAKISLPNDLIYMPLKFKGPLTLGKFKINKSTD